MRIVLDTNVVLSALLWRGTPYQLLSAIRQQSGVQLFSSTALLDELAVISKSARKALSDYVEAVELVEPTTVPRVVPTDPDDDQVIAAALTAHADLIVSGAFPVDRTGDGETQFTSISARRPSAASWRCFA